MADDAEPVEVVDDDPTKKPDEVKPDADAGDPAKPEPGTPDKAMQKMQQELGNVTRQLAALTEKKQAEGDLSEADKAKIQKAQQRIEKIRGFVNRPDRGDLPSDVDPVAEHVLDLTERVGEVDQLRSELREAKGQIGYLLNNQNWQIARTKYAGLDVDAIWDKAMTDAKKVLADAATPQAVNRLASNLFEERCEGAKKRQKDKPDPEPNNKGPAPDPSTYRVGSGQKPAPQLSEEDEALAEARALVQEI